MKLSPNNNFTSSAQLKLLAEQGGDMIDLASDTVTKPTPAMLDAMLQAPVGDDVYGEDPTVNKLQNVMAERFGMEDALFMPSGTMTNQVALNVYCRPGDEVICHRLSHIYVYEGGGIMANAGASVKLIGDARGLISAEEVAQAVNVNDIHLPRSRVVAVENTSNKGGGTCYDFATLQAVGGVARTNGLHYHLDGARLYNAVVARDESELEYGRLFDSISICLSKGLGCPVGSVLLGSRDFIGESRRIRKRLGGGWRQAGMLAAAGLYALDNNIERLTEDHEKARKLSNCLNQLSYVASVNPVETNIVIFHLASHDLAADLQSELSQKGIRALNLGGGVMRMTTHMDVSMEQIEIVCNVLCEMEKRDD